MKQRGLKVRPPVGTRVRLTGYFLKVTGQVIGSEGGKRWTVVSDCGFGPKCLCSLGRHLAVDEPTDAETQRTTYPDITSTRADGRLMRHIAMANLQVVGAPPRTADQADECPPVKMPFGTTTILVVRNPDGTRLVLGYRSKREATQQARLRADKSYVSLYRQDEAIRLRIVSAEEIKVQS
jgi:hypothetical protein